MKKKRKKRKRNGGANGGGGCWNIRRKTGRTSRIREGTKLGDQGRGGLNDQNSLLTFQLIFQRGGRGLELWPPRHGFAVSSLPSLSPVLIASANARLFK